MEFQASINLFHREQILISCELRKKLTDELRREKVFYAFWNNFICHFCDLRFSIDIFCSSSAFSFSVFPFPLFFPSSVTLRFSSFKLRSQHQQCLWDVDFKSYTIFCRIWLDKSCRKNPYRIWNRQSLQATLRFLANPFVDLFYYVSWYRALNSKVLMICRVELYSWLENMQEEENILKK